MAKLLMGKAVADALTEQLKDRVAALAARGITPTLAIIRVGSDEGDLSYERGAKRRAEQLGVHVRSVILSGDIDVETLLRVIDELNADDSVHGVLMFRPLPHHLRPRRTEIYNRLDPKKDVDGMTDISCAGVYTGRNVGFPPCTAAACMELLDYYGIEPKGKRTVMIGRSLVVGRPAALMLMHRHATVTVIHTHTEDPRQYLPHADILICAAGVKGMVTGEDVRPGQVILDVSMNYDPNKVTSKGRGGMVGDCDFRQVEPIVEAITPVPGGVGAVTNTVLMKHVIQAAEKA